MPRAKEEIKAELVWRFVECLREEEANAGAGAVRFSREELEELVGVLETAGDLPTVLSTTVSESARQGARARLEEAVEAKVPTAAPRRAVPSRRPSMLAAMHFRFVAGMVMGLSLAVMTVGMWHKTANKTIVRRVPAESLQIHPMDEDTAHRLIRESANTEIEPGQEKDLMWHMIVCPGCYDEYREVRHRSRMTQDQAFQLTMEYLP